MSMKHDLLILRRGLLLCLFLLLVINTNCYAKLIYDDSGRISFETSNDWYYTQVEVDSDTTSLHSIANGKDTIISFQKSNIPMNYNTMRQMTELELSEARDVLLQFTMNFIRDLGWIPQIDTTNYSQESIFISFTLTKDNFKYKFATIYWIKNYTLYCLMVLGPAYTMPEAIHVADSLIIDAVPFMAWMKQ